MRYLLDTNILSDLMRNPQGEVFQKISQVGESQICTSVIVSSELWYGAQKSGSAQLKRRVRVVLGALDIEPFAPPADRIYGELRALLAGQGQLIGPNDLLIAAQALTLDCVLVSANNREFSRIKNLKLDNWLPEA